MRQQQLETEQFLFFEDQLKKQELARGQMRSQETPALSEQIDGSALSCFSPHQNNSLLNVFADQPNKSEATNYASHSPPVNRALKPAATLSAVQSKWINVSLWDIKSLLVKPYFWNIWEGSHFIINCGRTSPRVYMYTELVFQYHVAFTICTLKFRKHFALSSDQADSIINGTVFSLGIEILKEFQAFFSFMYFNQETYES